MSGQYRVPEDPQVKMQLNQMEERVAWLKLKLDAEVRRRVEAAKEAEEWRQRAANFRDEAAQYQTDADHHQRMAAHWLKKAMGEADAPRPLVTSEAPPSSESPRPPVTSETPPQSPIRIDYEVDPHVETYRILVRYPYIHKGSVSAQQLVRYLEYEIRRTVVHRTRRPYSFILVLFTVYMGLMYMSERDDGSYHMNTALRENLMEDKMFKKIDTHNDVYAWINATAKNFWVTEGEYNRAVAERGHASLLNRPRTLLVGINRTQTGNGLFAERQNYPLHFMLLRQKRVETRACASQQAAPLHSELWRRIENTCIDRLSRSDSEGVYLRNVSRAFPHITLSTRSVPYTDVTTDPFLTDGPKGSQLPPMRDSRGLTHTYSGDDKLYSAKLPYQELFLGDVEGIVADLKASDWIDFTTRVVAVETLVYNAVLREYVVLRYVVEFTHSGHVTTFSTSEPFWLMLLGSGGWHPFAFMCDIVLCFYVPFSVCELLWKFCLSVLINETCLEMLVSDWKFLHVLHLGSLIACLYFRLRLWRRSDDMSSDLLGTDLYGDLLSYQDDFAWAKHFSTAALWVTYLRFYEYFRFQAPPR